MMKKLLIYAAGLLLLTACGDDEDPMAPISIGEKVFAIETAKTVDYGAYDGYYNYDLYLTDGTLTAENTPENATVFIYSELFFYGTEAFEAGVFQLDAKASDKKSYIGDVLVAIDENADGQITKSDAFLPAKTGTITLNGSNNTYKISFNLTLGNDQVLKGDFNGTLDYESKR